MGKQYATYVGTDQNNPIRKAGLNENIGNKQVEANIFYKVNNKMNDF